MKNSKRAIYNTLIMYLKMLVTIVISLLTTRLVLNALGAEDYGIFNVVAGIIAMLSFLKSAMMLSSQRYMSYYIGKGIYKKLQAIYSTSVLLHFGLGLLIVIFLFSIGDLLFSNVLRIPENRLSEAQIVYYFMIINVFFTIVSVPFDALINAYEHLVVFAVVETLGAILKLGVAFYLYFTNIDKLVVYSLLIGGVTFVMFLLKWIWCRKSYPSIRYTSVKNVKKEWFVEMMSFAGWNTFGAACGIGRIQGVAVVLNMFFGTIINASYGIAIQVNGQFQLLSVTMLQAINPQIIKAEGSGQRDKMILLSMIASKFSFFFLSFIALPFILEMPFILKVWLNNIPENTIIFSRLIILLTLVNQLSIGLQTAVQAIGKIRWYQIGVGSLILLTLPGGYVLLKNGFPAYSVLVLAICIEIAAVFFRILFLKFLTNMSMLQYSYKVIFKSILPLFVSLALLLIPYSFMEDDLYRFILTCVLSSTLLAVCIVTCSLTRYEKGILKEIGLGLIKKIRV